MGAGERKKASAALGQQSDVARKQLDLSRGIIEESAPWRAVAGNYYTGITKGGDELTKAVAPQINAVTRQYQTALKGAKELPLGGSRDRAIRETRLGEASEKAGIYSGGIKEAIDKLNSLGTAGTQMGMAGYGGSAENYGAVSRTYGQMADAKAQSVGSMAGGAGSIASMAAGGKPSATPAPKSGGYSI